MANVQELLQTITYKDEMSSQEASLGTVKEIFKDFEILPVKHSKNGARRATIMLRNKATGKLTNQQLVMSPAVTDLFRADKITVNHIAGFNVSHIEGKGFFVMLPSAGWIEVVKLTVAEYKPQAVSLEDTIA